MNKTNLHCPTCLHHLYQNRYGDLWCMDCGQFVDEENALSADEAAATADYWQEKNGDFVVE